MASRYFGVNRGATFTGVTQGSSTTSKDVELTLLLTNGLSKRETIVAVEEIERKIYEANWPPGTALSTHRAWSLNRGHAAIDVAVGSAVAATATVTCASVLESDTVTVNGRVLTAQDLREKFTVLCVADSAGSLNNTYFTFSKSGVNYYVWYNVNSAGTDPALAGKTAVPVALATNAANTAVASATNTAIDALAGVSSTVSSATVTVVIDAIGAVTDAAQGAASTGFTITVTRQGADSPGSNKFAMNTSDTATGDSLVAAIAASDQSGNIYGTNAAGVVTLTAVTAGTGGNSLTLATSNSSRLAKSGTALAGGLDAATGKDVRVQVLTTASLSKQDVFRALELIKDYVLKNIWPPA